MEGYSCGKFVENYCVFIFCFGIFVNGLRFGVVGLEY